MKFNNAENLSQINKALLGTGFCIVTLERKTLVLNEDGAVLETVSSVEEALDEIDRRCYHNKAFELYIPIREHIEIYFGELEGPESSGEMSEQEKLEESVADLGWIKRYAELLRLPRAVDDHSLVRTADETAQRATRMAPSSGARF